MGKKVIVFSLVPPGWGSGHYGPRGLVLTVWAGVVCVYASVVWEEVSPMEY